MKYYDRKPNIGMLKHLCAKNLPKHDIVARKDEMLMIGDASGKEGQFSDSDRRTADNFGIEYLDIEDFKQYVKLHKQRYYKKVMKELSIEEKAKAYDKVIKEVKDFFEGRTKMYNNVTKTLEFLFPELKENEDERIRKEIIDLLYNLASTHYLLMSNKEFDERIAWLEKQGKQDPTDLRTWIYIVADVLTAKNGIGQYLDDPWTAGVAKRLQERFCNIPQKPVDVKPHIPDGSSDYDKEWEEAQKYLGKRGFDIPWNDGDVFVDARYITQTVANVLAWGDEHPKQKIDCYQNSNRPNGGIVSEDFTDGEGFYKLNLAYLNKKQVEEIEEIVKAWNNKSDTSEDNIKDCIKICLTDVDEQRFKDYNTNLRDCLVWLERQGEQNPTWSKEDENMCEAVIDVLVNNTMSGSKGREVYSEEIELLESIKERYNWKPSVEQKKDFKEKYNNITNSEWFKKTYEDKSVSEEELESTPVYKIGDWVILDNNCRSLYQIEKIENYKYYLRHYLGGAMPLNFSDEEDLRLWTIDDANEGDVLATEDSVFIFKCKSESGITHCRSYCAVIGKVDFSVFEFDFSGLDIHPATIEQRNMLFEKMKEVGYEWNAEKKELTIVEQNPTDKVEPKFKVGDKILYRGNMYKVTGVERTPYNKFRYDVDCIDTPIGIDYNEVVTGIGPAGEDQMLRYNG